MSTTQPCTTPIGDYWESVNNTTLEPSMKHALSPVLKSTFPVSKWDLNLYAILRGLCPGFCDKIFYLWHFNSRHKTIAVMCCAKANENRESVTLNLCCPML
ncbi:CLUMA_CG004713, isoform A [Clunio marinus]|uniref:CLUMA_CG004713, isoform A n=1 Tax=Clunio marinus TaxID=568069 RepID=A0A1J1HY07_9DIPT|nr:CLUMA_CG004713, isoform A [Clunio marinus]